MIMATHAEKTVHFEVGDVVRKPNGKVKRTVTGVSDGHEDDNGVFVQPGRWVQFDGKSNWYFAQDYWMVKNIRGNDDYLNSRIAYAPETIKELVPVLPKTDEEDTGLFNDSPE